MERVTYTGRSPFYQDLKQRVAACFEESGRQPTGNASLYLKTIVCAGGFVGCYLWLLLGANTWMGALLGVVGAALTMSMTGFNVMHDGAHGAYSASPRINWLMAYTLDLLGGSNFLWRQKHNILHHTYTNVDQLDRDLQSSGMMRMSPDQPWHPAHRWQHLYALPLYSLHTFFWVIFRDYVAFRQGRAGPVRLATPTTGDRVAFYGAKGFYYAYALVLPCWFHPVSTVLLAYTGVHLVAGVVLSIIFQLAHTTDGPRFPQADNDEVEEAWAVSQVETTADFAHGNRLLSWCVGGLNYQIEHHLFPRVSHVHYPALAPIVQQACADHGVRYQNHPTLRAAVAAHFRFLQQMGRPPVGDLSLAPATTH